MKFSAIDQTGVEHHLDGRDGWTLMEILNEAGLLLAPECGGSCICGTCHVYVDESWTSKLEPASEGEVATLDLAFDVKPNSRLSCQIVCGPALDGLKLRIGTLA
jgi:2Fe-2S ferredoxin